VLTDEWLTVELVQAGKVERCKLARRWMKLDPPAKGSRLIGLESSGVRVEIGRFLTEYKRRELILELRQELWPAILPGA
jgi:hypothetical protein